MLEETTTLQGQPDSKDEETLSCHHPSPQRSLLSASVDDTEQAKNESPMMEASQQGELKDNMDSLTESGHREKQIGKLFILNETANINNSNMSRISPVEAVI